MTTYFKPLRRKVGVVTLVVACLVSMGWVRSSGGLDIVYINGKTSNLVIVSGGQKLWVANGGSFNVLYTNAHPSQFVLDWVPHELLPSRSLVDFYRHPASTVRIHDSQERPMYMAPYWSIVIPLTLISAWLLLSRPRAPKPPAKQG